MGGAAAITLTARKFAAFRRQQRGVMGEELQEEEEEEEHEARARRAAASAAKEAKAAKTAAALAASYQSSPAPAVKVKAPQRTATASPPRPPPPPPQQQQQPQEPQREVSKGGKGKKKAAAGRARKRGGKEGEGLRARVLRSVALSEAEEELGVRSDLNGQVASLEEQVLAVERLLRGMPLPPMPSAELAQDEEESDPLHVSSSSSSSLFAGFAEEGQQGPELEQYAYGTCASRRMGRWVFTGVPLTNLPFSILLH